jgi:HEPN domain-containing protein
MRRLTARWVRKAEADLTGARSLARTGEAVNDIVCFHCQQSAEKHLKAVLQELGLPVPRTPNLAGLLILLTPHHPSLRFLGRALKSLSRHAVDYRYPGLNANRRQALAALRHAEQARTAVRSLLGLPP